MTKILYLIAGLLFASLQSGAQWSSHNVTFDGMNREYKVYTPAGYNASVPASLILVLHGLQGTMSDVETIGITEIADTANIVLVSPQALNFSSPLGLMEAVWNSGIVLDIPGFGTIPVNADVDDAGFINSILEATLLTHNIKEDRIYMAGASLGGFMTQKMACAAGNKLAAIATVMGTYALALPLCNPGKVLPMAHFHGTLDDVVDYQGNFLFGSMSLPIGLSVDELVSSWVTLNDANPTATHTAWPNTNNDNFWIDHYRYDNAEGQSLVELFKVNGGTHTWYDYGNTDGEIDYATEIWKFFNRQYYSTSIAGVNNNKTRLAIFPNPVESHINLPQVFKSGVVSITNMLGQLVHRQSVTAGEPVDVSTLGTGTYILQLVSDKNERMAARFVKKN
jgi:polyhydroxybutyrate depolymerase